MVDGGASESGRADGQQGSSEPVYDPEPIIAVLLILGAVGDTATVVSLVRQGLHVLTGQKREQFLGRLYRLEDELREIESAEQMLMDVISDPEAQAQDAPFDFGEPLFLPKALQDRYYRAVDKLTSSLTSVTRTVARIQKSLPSSGEHGDLGPDFSSIEQNVRAAQAELREIMRSQSLVVPEALRLSMHATERMRSVVRVLSEGRQ